MAGSAVFVRQFRCQNPVARADAGRSGSDAVIRDLPQIRRILRWLLIALLAALISYYGFRGYLGPEMLLNFSNTFTC